LSNLRRSERAEFSSSYAQVVRQQCIRV